jgi:hypothetical protein
MKKKLAVLLLLFSFLSFSLFAEELPPMPDGPLILTSVTPDQLSADYWINRLPNPDLVLKTPQEIHQLNQEIRAMLSSQIDIFELEPHRRGIDIRDQLEFEYQTVKGRVLFDVEGAAIPKTIFEEKIKPVMQWEKVPEKIKLKWGAATRATSVRALPTDVKMLEEIGDIEFDQLQYTLIKLWTPVAVYYTSQDGQWVYIQAPYVRGWVKASDIALFPDRDTLKKYFSADFLVVTGESILINVDASLERALQKPSMGTLLPLAGRTEGVYQVWMPYRKSNGSVTFRRGFVAKEADVSAGFLSYTHRPVRRQASPLRGARHGWGGMYDGRDCSGFTQDAFLPFGIAMPRNSKDQAFVGTQINHFEPMKDPEGKTNAIRAGTPGLTLLRMPLHQMIYLGEIDGKFYAIHSTWAERISMTSDEKVRINQVVLSDLSLNGKSYLGSLFDRIISVSEIL